MPKTIEMLLKYLQVEQTDEFQYSGRSPSYPKRIFGGQVFAQCLYAGSQSVAEGFTPHSQHAYFLRPGDPKKPLRFEVEPIRDGRSFCTRRVVALQNDKPIFNTSISFTLEEQGLTHQFDMPEVPGPEELETEQDFLQRMSDKYPGKFTTSLLGQLPFERRSLKWRDPMNPQAEEPYQTMWIKLTENPGDDQLTHKILLAYLSDMGLLGTALFPHPHTVWSKQMQAASLDHSLWFHRPFRADEWLLFSSDSPSAAGGRGFSRASFYSWEGELVASAVQESLIRLRQ